MLKLRDVKLGAGRRSHSQSSREADLLKENKAATSMEAKVGGHVFPERQSRERERESGCFLIPPETNYFSFWVP